MGSVAAALDLSRSHHGIGRFMAYQVADDIRVGRLVRLLVPFELEPAPVHLLFHGRPQATGGVRAFLDHATQPLRRTIAAIDDMPD